MRREIDIDALLAPIPGDNPGGEDVRYTQAYEDIKEARKFDEALDLGDWKREVRTADWDKAITLAVDALISKSKDLQIAAWLTEAFIKTEGFDGLATGLKIITGLMQDFWENLYPPVEEGDLDFRAAPLEFMNEKLWSYVKQVPLTDEHMTPGYSWLKWQESREVGLDADTRNKYGDVDENKKKKRDESVAEGKLTAEEFDAAVAASSGAFYKSLAESLTSCLDEFRTLDATVDEKFGQQAPRLAEIGKAIEDCNQLVLKIYKEKGPVSAAEPSAKSTVRPATQERKVDEVRRRPAPPSEEVPTLLRRPSPSPEVSGTGPLEGALWEEALQVLEAAGIKEALDGLLEASFSAPSVREKNRYRLLMAKLCLQAERPDLARPIVEELYALIEELHLDRWESPVWIAEVLDAVYRCLTSGEPSDEDQGKARMLFQKLCTTDVTKAITYRH
jgi:type VI secretion system protein ImpA